MPDQLPSEPKADADLIYRDDFADASGWDAHKGTFGQLVSAYEKELITDALKDARGNQTDAARILGTTKRIIQYKIQQDIQGRC